MPKKSKKKLQKNKKWMKGLIWINHYRGLFFGHAGKTEKHSPHAIKICFAMGDNKKGFWLKLDEENEWRLCQAAIIAPDQEHQVSCYGRKIAIFYLMPETVEARLICKKYPELKNGAVKFEWNQVSELSSRLSIFLEKFHFTSQQAVELFDDLLSGFGISESKTIRQSLDPRVERALKYLERMIEENFGENILVEEIAKFTKLSASRLAHVFKNETQIAVHKYQIWLKLINAIKELSFSDSLDYIAIATGFHDQSQINKHFVKMHGVLPSVIRNNCKIIISNEVAYRI